MDLSPTEGQGCDCSIRVGSVGGMWMGKRKMGVAVRALAFSLLLRGRRKMREPSDVGFYPGRSSGTFCPLGGMFALLGRASRWQRTLKSDKGLSQEQLGEQPRVLLGPAAWGAQLGLGKQDPVLRDAPGWLMGVFPRSCTKGPKSPMKHSFLIVDKRGAWPSGARRLPPEAGVDSQPPRGHLLGSSNQPCRELKWMCQQVTDGRVQRVYDRQSRIG